MANDAKVVEEWQGYSSGSLDFLAQIPVRNEGTLLEAAKAILAAVDSGHLLYSVGAGHSIGGVIETFFRAGGLPFVYPLWEPRIFPLNSAPDSTAAEREEGVGLRVAQESPMGPGDVVIVFSNTGINYYPVEVAKYAREAGATVIAVTSVGASKLAPLRAGARLFELADIVIDTAVPPGDVFWPREAAAVAPLSSLGMIQAWNLIMVALVTLQPDLGTWQSANVGSDGSHNERLQAEYAPRIPPMN